LVILIPLLLILLPLSQSFSHLKQQYIQQRQDNNIRRIANNFWQQQFAKLPSGEQRSVLDQTTISELNGKMTLSLRVFTSQPYTTAERNEFAHLVAASLNRPVNSVEVQLLEIPTTAGMLAARTREEKPIEAPPTVAQLRANFWQSVQAALAGLRFPPAAQLLDYQLVTGSPESTRVIINYLAENEITTDAQALIAEDVQARLSDSTLAVTFERHPRTFGPLTFRRNDATISTANLNVLEQAAKVLQAHPACQVEISAQREANESSEVNQARADAVIEYFVSQAKLDRTRFKVTPETAAGRNVMLKLQVTDKP